MTSEAYKDSDFRLSNRKRLLKGLFYELAPSDKIGVKYTLKDEDHHGYPSLSRLYLETEDPTEYLFATSYLESWDHWEMLCAANWFQPYIARWRRELEVKIKSQEIRRIRDEAKNGGRNSFTASKWLVDRGWEPKEGQGTKRGRPTKEDINKAANELAIARESINEDYERIIN